jgi:hypothetical protein
MAMMVCLANFWRIMRWISMSVASSTLGERVKLARIVAKSECAVAYLLVASSRMRMELGLISACAKQKSCFCP